MPADGLNTGLATAFGKNNPVKADWEAYCDSLPGCNDVKVEKGLGTKESDGGENGGSDGGGTDNTGQCPPENDGPGPQPTCE